MSAAAPLPDEDAGGRTELIEITSPATRSRDLTVKRAPYERWRVPAVHDCRRRHRRRPGREA
jgi:hypothetical protein